MEEQNYIVYQHSIILNNVVKRYIGITSCQNPEKRWQNGKGYRPHGHSKTGKLRKENSCRFYNAILKYGWDSFKHEVLYSNLTKAEAEDKERELITMYKTYLPEFGYNMDMGGNSRGKHSETTREKISRNHANVKGANHPECKGSVIQLDLQGNEIMIYDSIRDAAEKSGVSDFLIRQTVTGKYKSGGQFQWFYYYDYLAKQKEGEVFIYYDSRPKKVAKINDEGEIIEVFPNMKLAGISVGIPEKQASARILISINNQHKCSGYYWQKI